MVTAKSRRRQNATTTDLGLVEGLDELGGGGGLLAGGLGEDELDLGQHLGLPDIHGGSEERGNQAEEKDTTGSSSGSSTG